MHPSNRPARRPPRLRTLAGSALAAAALLLVALSGVGGSYALWSVAATADAGTIGTGGAGLSAVWDAGHDDAAWSNLLPGESVRQPLTLANTGDVALSVAATATTAAGWEIRVAAGACGAPLPGAALGAAPRSVGALAPRQSVAACLEVRGGAGLTPAATASGVAFGVTFDATQVPR